ncbi:MAG: hypothetical protein ACKN9T_18985 [Candidatus Methylumidiphilus sp.]
MASATAALAEIPAPIHSVDISSTRDYGIAIGEVISSEVRVAVELGYELETAALPQPGSAVNDYLELRDLRRTRHEENGEAVYGITLNYQVFKGVRDTEALTVPAVPLRFHRAEATAETQTPAWNFTLAPIIPAKTPDEAVILRGDMPTPSHAGVYPGRWLAAYLTGLLCFGVYALWRLGLMPFGRHATPFDRAARQIDKLGKRPANLDLCREAAKRVHAALNETAGQVVVSGQLAHFLAAQPEYARYEKELAQFFAESDRLFYADATDCPKGYFTMLKNVCQKMAAVGAKR